MANAIASHCHVAGTGIATAAIQNILGGEDGMKRCRKPEIMADAAWHILTNTSGATGNFYIDDAVLQAHGVTDLDKYAVKPGTKNFLPDFFVD